MLIDETIFGAVDRRTPHRLAAEDILAGAVEHALRQVWLCNSYLYNSCTRHNLLKGGRRNEKRKLYILYTLFVSVTNCNIKWFI